MLPPIYSKSVIAHYHRRLANRELSIDIRQLSPGSLKAACAEACRERYYQNDNQVLRGFFEGGSDRETFLRAIDRTELDKFRPLVYFLKGKTKNPDDKVVEVIAWLIDFKPRPYDPTVDYSPGPLPAGSPEVSPQPTLAVFEKRGKKRKRIIFTITISIAFGMSVLVWPRKSRYVPKDEQSCMFWNGDRYQPVSCSEKVQNVQVVALDTTRLYHFQKITRPDTITQNAVGHVWYARYRGNYEFYTADGPHPVDPNLRVLPITPGIVIHHTPLGP